MEAREKVPGVRRQAHRTGYEWNRSANCIQRPLTPHKNGRSSVSHGAGLEFSLLSVRRLCAVHTTAVACALYESVK